MRGAAALYVGLGVLQRALNLLLLPFVTRSMSVEEYGMTSLLVAGAALLNIVLSLAAEPTVVSASVRAPTDPAELTLLRAARRVLLFGAPAAGVALAAICWAAEQPVFGVPAHLWSIEIVAMGLAVFAQTYALPRLRVQLRLKAFAVVSLATIGATIVGKLVLVVMVPLGALGWVLADLGAGAAAIFAAVIVLRNDRLGRGPLDFSRFFRLSIPLIPHLGSLWIIGSIRLPLVEATQSLQDVGLFAAAASAGSLPMILALEVNRASSVEYAHDRFPAPSPRSGAAMSLQLSFAVLLVVGLCAVAPAYVAIVLPPAYAGIEPIVAVIGLGAVFWTVYAIATAFTTMVARIVHLTWIPSAIGAAATVIGTIALGSVWGLLGVAIAAVASQVIMATGALLIQAVLKLKLDWRRGGVTWRWLALALAATTLAITPLLLDWDFMPWAIATGLAVALSLSDFVRNIRARPTARN